MDLMERPNDTLGWEYIHAKVWAEDLGRGELCKALISCI
jgi:hypothetical protein